MSGDTAGDWREALWAEIAPQLRRIVGRSATPSDLDDVLQDVAERFFRQAPEFPNAGEGLAWATVVARRRLIDLSRRVRPIPTAEVKAVSCVDTERSAIGQLALDCARRFMSEHGIRESWISGREDGPADAKERMSRSRARRRVADHVGRKVGWPALIPRLRWLMPALGVTAMVPLPFAWSPEASEAHGQTGPKSSQSTEHRDLQPPEPARAPAAIPVVFAKTPKHGGDPAPSPRGAEPKYLGAEAPLPWGSARVKEEPNSGNQDAPAPLVCVWGVVIAPDTCVDHPLK